MGNRVNPLYLAICCIVLSALALFPGAEISVGRAGNISWGLALALAASFTYPLAVRHARPDIRFWKGAMLLGGILALALVCGFIAYLAQYAWYKHRALGSEFHLFEALSWTLDESLTWFIFSMLCQSGWPSPFSIRPAAFSPG